MSLPAVGDRVEITQAGIDWLEEDCDESPDQRTGTVRVAPVNEDDTVTIKFDDGSEFYLPTCYAVLLESHSRDIAALFGA